MFATEVPGCLLRGITEAVRDRCRCVCSQLAVDAGAKGSAGVCTKQEKNS